MARLTLTQSPSVKLAPTHQLVHMLKVANLMEMPEKDFANVVFEIENHPLFKQYIYSNNPKERLFGYKRFPKSSIATGFLELKENTSSTTDEPGIEDYLQDKNEVIEICQKIGIEKFKTLFLYNDGSISLDQMSKDSGLTPEQVQKTIDLVNHVALEEEFRSESAPQNNLHEHYNRIASFEKEPSGEFNVKFNSLRYARGRYSINYDNFIEMKKKGNLSKEELKSLKELIKKMELINSRKSTLYQILEKISDRQHKFLESQDPGHLHSLTQLELARELDIHSSTISRAIYGKSVAAPWNEEIPLKVFLVKGPVNQIKAAIYNLVSEEEKKIKDGQIRLPYRDEEIKNLLRSEKNMIVATRTIAKYRSELGISNVYVRAEAYKTKKAQDFSKN